VETSQQPNEPYWRKLEDYVLEHYPCSQTWEEGSLRNWLLWAASERFLFTVIKNEQVFGITIAKPLNDVTSVTRPDDKHDPNSKNIYVDLTIATGADAMKFMILAIVSRFGVREKLCFHRHGRSYVPKFYDFRKFSQKILRS
jgi:hypothetical protein